MDKIKNTFTPAVRAWIYRVATAALLLAVVYGLIDSEAVNAWQVLVAAVTGMAALNTPTGTQDQ